jgi:hypothetical protein
MKFVKSTFFLIIIMLAMSSCGGIQEPVSSAQTPAVALESVTPPVIINQLDVTTTPRPTRPTFSPGELVDYIAQTGDTLPALASHFNTKVDEILDANSFIPKDATTMPPGMPMKIPIYYAPFWGSQYKIIPDSQFINGPATVGFDTSEFVAQHPGWLNGFTQYAFNGTRTGAEIIDYVALNYSISPRLLLALLEYQAGALSLPTLPEEMSQYPLGYRDWQHAGLYMQLVWAANLLNNAYYNWRLGQLVEFDHLDGTQERPDPWQNAATVALQYYFSRLVDGEQYDRAIAQDGYAQSFQSLFGDKILFVGHGTVIAGIDLQKMQPEDMRYENGVLTVKLPPAEIFIAALDNDKSYVYNRDTGLLTKPDINLETLVRQRAEEEILKAALEDGILQQAQTNAEAYLLKFFNALGFPNTIFTYDQG